MPRPAAGGAGAVDEAEEAVSGRKEVAAFGRGGGVGRRRRGCVEGCRGSWTKEVG